MHSQETDLNSLVDNFSEIYAEIKPSLISIAYKYKVPNPDEFADEWLSKAYMIIKRFETGELEKKVYQNSSEISDTDRSTELVDYNPSVHSIESLNDSLKAYLKRSYVNDVIKQYNRRKKQVNYQKQYAETHLSIGDGGYSSIDSFLHYDSIYIDDILSLLELDIKRLSVNTTSVLDMVTKIFLNCIQSHCQDMKVKYGNFIVVKDVDIDDNKRFFSESFRNNLENGVRKKLCDVILSSSNPVLIEKLSYLINPQKRGTLQKRLFRYFFEYHNGYPKRLRNRVHSKTLR